MRGNSHVRFLGGWGAAMRPGYPTRVIAVSKGASEMKRLFCLYYMRQTNTAKPKQIVLFQALLN